MTWRYSQSTGVLTYKGAWVYTGYSGHGNGKNNHFVEHLIGIGPIPMGKWKMTQVRIPMSALGPFVIYLEPVGHKAHGRSLFRIHGDSVKTPGNASHGCIIMPLAVRKRMWESTDHFIDVVQ